ncbi:MAG: hypothetical protein QFB86_01825 [Patescibacteria group bacterium]|nr:hypothetical protein [Patescibacteria group bacterium]
MKTNIQSGFSHVLVVVALLVVGVTGFAGYRVMHSSSSNDSTVSMKASEPAVLHNAADVRKAKKALDETASTDVNPSQLDSELNALL